MQNMRCVTHHICPHTSALPSHYTLAPLPLFIENNKEKEGMKEERKEDALCRSPTEMHARALLHHIILELTKVQEEEAKLLSSFSSHGGAPHADLPPRSIPDRAATGRSPL
jgi:hypothetical protein